MKRKTITSETQEQVLYRSRRRCALCYAYNFDFGQKKGQIAHLDHNPSNNAQNNLVFLCLEHHDQYDSTTSQSKSLTREEVLRSRTELDNFIEQKLAQLEPEIENLESDDKIEKKVKEELKKTEKIKPISIELYQLRLPVYEAYRKLIGKIIRDAKLEIDELFEFSRDTHHALFLFDSVLADYLTLIYRKGFHLRSLQKQMEARRNDLDADAWTNLINEECDTLKWLSNIEDGRKLFKKYLHLG